MKRNEDKEINIGRCEPRIYAYFLLLYAILFLLRIYAYLLISHLVF